MKNGARFGATSHPDPTDATHGRLKDSDLARCLKPREMALWVLEKKRQFSPFLWGGTSHPLIIFTAWPSMAVDTVCRRHCPAAGASVRGPASDLLRWTFCISFACVWTR
jgi:hypothetical protein